MCLVFRVLFDGCVVCCGCAVGREFAPAGDLLSFAPPKESRQRKGGPTGRVPFGATCDARARGGAAELASFTAFSSLRQRQRVRARCAHASLRARPRPVLLGTARRGVKSIRAIASLGPRLGGAAASRGEVLLPLPLGEGWGEVNPSDQIHRGQLPSQPSPSGGRSNTEAERSDGQNSALTPSGCAEERSGRGARMQRSMHSLGALTRCRCLSGESAANKASSAAAPRLRAPQVARSEAEGRNQWGRLSFAYFSLAEQRKVGAPPGAHPGQQRIQSA